MSRKCYRHVWFFGLICSGLAVNAATQGQTVRYVDDDATGANNGSSWADAFTELQSALEVAEAGDEIRVARGIYKPDYDVEEDRHTGDRQATFQLLNGVALKGGYAGCEAPDADERNIRQFESILSGDLAGDDVEVSNPEDLFDEPSRAENSYHIVTGSGTEHTAVLDGFTISGGNANGSYPHYSGGGMHNYSGSPTASACTFRGNAASSSGGGMLNEGGSDPTLIGCTFVINSGRYGGGMHNRNHSNPSLENCTFLNNSADDWGGGMYSYLNSRVTLTSCTFIANSAEYGGAMYNGDAGSNPTLSNCTFSRNSAEQSGGGIWTLWGDPILRNCMFVANAAGRSGGGVYNDSGSPTLVNCTLVGNSAEHLGRGLWTLWSESVVTSCILWGNTNEAGSDQTAQVHGSSSLFDYSCVQGWSEGRPGEGNTSDDPLFVDPDGGDEILGTPDDNLRLAPGSPCINTGDPDLNPDPTETDLDGHARVLCARVDMGAYECGMGDYDCNEHVDLTDLVEWGGCTSGPHNGPYQEGCEVFDFDPDLDVDLHDFAGFQIAFRPGAP